LKLFDNLGIKMILKKSKRVFFFFGLILVLLSTLDFVFPADTVNTFRDVLSKMVGPVKKLKVIELERINSVVDLACDRLSQTYDQVDNKKFSQNFRGEFKSFERLVIRLHKKYCRKERMKLQLCDVRDLRDSLNFFCDDGFENERKLFTLINCRICKPLLKNHGSIWERVKDFCCHPFDRIESWSGSTKVLSTAAAGAGLYYLLKSSDSNSGFGWSAGFSSYNQDGILHDAWNECSVKEPIEQRFIRMEDGIIYRIEDSDVEINDDDPRQYIVRSVPSLFQNDGYSCGFYALWNLLLVKDCDIRSGISVDLSDKLLSRSEFEKKYGDWIGRLLRPKGTWMTDSEAEKIFQFEVNAGWQQEGIFTKSSGEFGIPESVVDLSRSPISLIVFSSPYDTRTQAINKYLSLRHKKKIAWEWTGRMEAAWSHITALKIDKINYSNENSAVIITVFDSFGNDNRFSNLAHNVFEMLVRGDIPRGLSNFSEISFEKESATNKADWIISKNNELKWRCRSNFIVETLTDIIAEEDQS
jgi:hypothetical protein